MQDRPDDFEASAAADQSVRLGGRAVGASGGAGETAASAQPGAGPAAGGAAPPHEPGAAGIRAGGDSAERLSAIVSKGLDLAESGLSVGLALVDRLGNLAQQTLDGVVAQRRERDGGAPYRWPPASAGVASPAGGAQAPPGSRPFDDTGAPQHDASPDAPEQPTAPMQAQEPAYCITNRLPLRAGESVRVSFSVNNDSADRPKAIALQVEGFIGETTGTALDADGFRVEPERVSIAPMDFEKLILTGRLPAGVPADIYRGRVLIAADQALEIMVRLAVSAAEPAVGDGGGPPPATGGDGAKVPGA
jgi:hypothetical protein